MRKIVKFLKKLNSIICSDLLGWLYFSVSFIICFVSYKTNDIRNMIYSGILTVIFLLLNLCDRKDNK